MWDKISFNSEIVDMVLVLGTFPISGVDPFVRLQEAVNAIFV